MKKDLHRGEDISKSSSRKWVKTEWTKVGMFRVSKEGNILLADQTMAATLGYKDMKELIDLSVESLFYHNDDKNIITELLQKKSISGGLNSEMFLKKLDGSPVSISLSLIPIYTENNTIQYFDGYIKDITHQKNVEYKLLKSEHRLKNVFDNAADGILIADTKNRRFIFSNPMICKMLGYTHQEILRLGVDDIHPSGELPDVLDLFERQVKKEFSLAKNITLLRKDGGRFYADVNSYPIELENRDCLVGFFRDVTERKQAEEKILTNFLTLDSIINSLDAIVFSVDANYRYTSFNKNHALVMKSIYGADIMIGSNILDYMTVIEDRKTARQNIDRALSGEHIVEESYSGKITLSRQYFHVSHNPIKSAEGEVIGVAMLAQDLTDRKKNEEVNISRLHLVEFSLTHSLDELLEETLNETEKITDSLIGFYHFVEEDEKFLSLQCWSTRTKKIFCKAEAKGMHYAVGDAGVWVECIHERKPVIHNDYYSLSNRKGMPEGHTPVSRELVVPVLRNNKIAAILGVGNKVTDYTEKDVELVTLFANLAWEIAERKRIEEALKDSEKQINRKLNAILSPDIDTSQLDLQDIIDCEKVQLLLGKFYSFTDIGIGVLDLKGNAVVKVGWPDICTKFHRANPQSCQLCEESDLELSSNIQAGTFKQYKCKNNMWDIITPIMLGGRHIGNILVGQFLYEGEVPDYKIFHESAIKFGFDEAEYLEALARVPRWKPETVNSVMSFCSSLAEMIGDLSYSQIRLANSLELKRHAEDALLMLNRELKAVVRCNQYLMKSDDENGLLYEICKIICEETGYLLAWVGYLEHDEEKTLIPVASAGDEGYIQDARLSWGDESDRGKGPAGIAIRTGETVIVENIATDSKMEPWRENALKHGYYSGMSIPLRNEKNEVFGVLNIYSGYIRAIDDNERRLMEELAGDLAYGIVSIRARKERDQIEALRQISEERFSKVFSQSPVAIVIVRSNDTCIVDVNDLFVRASGYNREELVGTDILSLNFFTNPGDFERIISQVNETGAVKGYELNINRKNQDKRVVLCTTIELNLVGEKHYLTLIQDITERKKTENELLKLSNAIEQSPISVVITDPNGNIEYVNPKFVEKTGYSREEVIGKNPRILKSGELPPEAYKAMWKIITSGIEWTGEFHNRKKNGELFWEQVSISSLKDSGGNILNFIALKEDITEKKKILEDLKISKIKAEESSLLKSAFLSNISHEIRTPVNGIVGFSDLLSDRSISEVERDMYLKMLVESSERMLSTIVKLVEMSKIETEQVTIDMVSINLNKCIEDIFQLYKPEIEKKGLIPGLNNTLYTKDIQLEVDKNKLEAIINYFIKNAIKYTAKGFVEFGIVLSDDQLTFYVKDSGVGIPASRLESIFHRFVQADISYTRPFDGLGLGLSIANAYAALMGGSIEVESTEGVGSTFKFLLPFYHE